jgi:polar amino acid transport system substrate-binding protein
MKWFPKGYQLAIVAVLSGALLAGSAHAQLDLAQIKARGKVVVATEAAYAPFEFIQDGKIVGYDEDVLNKIIESWGVQLQQIDVPFAGILTGLLEKKYDFVCTGLLMNAERAAKYAFTLPVAVAPIVIVKRKGDSKVTSTTDLSGLTIGGVVPPSGPTILFTNYNKQLGTKGAGKIVHFQNDPDLFLGLVNGQVDAVSDSLLVASEFMKKQPDQFEVVGAFGTPIYIGWVTRPEDGALRDAISVEIRKLRDNGTLAELQKKWFGFEMKIPDTGYLPEGAK